VFHHSLGFFFNELLMGECLAAQRLPYWPRVARVDFMFNKVL